MMLHLSSSPPRDSHSRSLAVTQLLAAHMPTVPPPHSRIDTTPPILLLLMTITLVVVFVLGRKMLVLFLCLCVLLFLCFCVWS